MNAEPIDLTQERHARREVRQMNVKQLRERLAQFPDELPVFMPANPLGHFAPLDDADLAMFWPYVPGDMRVGSLWLPDEVVPDQPSTAVAGLFLWPGDGDDT